MKKLNNVVGLNEEAMELVLMDENSSKSSKIKALFDAGLAVKDIASLVGVRYNFVYNVVSNYVITQGIEVEATKKDSKKDAVWAMFDEGKKLMEVCRELKMNYNYAWKLHKEWELAAVKEAAVSETK